MKHLEKQQAIALRSQGLSYREIQASVPVSRGSLSRWLQDIQLTNDQHERLLGKSAGTRRMFVAWNHLRQTTTQARKRAIRERSRADIGRLTGRELQLIGSALYWAEGSKGVDTSVVEFVNTDPSMIALIMRWFRLCCHVPEPKFRARVQFHDAARQETVEAFWSEITEIPRGQFTRPFLKLSPSSQRKLGNRLPYGTIHIRIADVQLLEMIQGWIKGLGLAPSSSPAQDVSFSG